MNIEDLRQIGKTLLAGVADIGRSAEMKTALGIGAGGDKTFPIDKMADEIIISGLRKLREPLTVISEETGTLDMNGGGTKVLIDPIDGSKNAVSGIPFYCTSIAVADGDTLGDVRLAYVLNLITGDEFWAESGSGAFLSGERIHTQKEDEFFLIAYEAPIPQNDLPPIVPLLSRSRKTRCLGSTALDLAYLSLGAVSVFVSASPSRSFDFAGGWLLVKESGGIVTDTKGREIENVLLGLKRSTSLLAAGNRILHEKALGLLQEKTR